MATNDTHQPKRGRQLNLQVTHVLRKRIAFDDHGLEGEIGVLPDRAIILSTRVYVLKAFNAGALDIGEEGRKADAFASKQALDKAAIVLTDLKVEQAWREQETVVTFARSAVAAAGEAIIVIEYAVDN